METAFKLNWQKAVRGLLLSIVLAVLGGAMAPAYALDQGQLFVTEEAGGYARLILSFPDRDSLPAYTIKADNGVLSIQFEQPVNIQLPDVGTILPNYVSIARVDPDGKGLRLALKSGFNFNKIDAGEKLFVDLLPLSWQGMPPALPQDVIDELAERARLAAIKAEQERKAAGALELKPAATVRIGRNPTFMRVQFDWSVDTTAKFEQNDQTGEVTFEWPVDVNMLALATDLPAEILSVNSANTPDGATVTMAFAKGVTPRFYETSPRQYVIDVDLAGAKLPELTAPDLAKDAAAADAAAQGASAHPDAPNPINALYPQAAHTVTPFVSVLGSTVRVVFPFEQDTPAAVFRRGDTVWMLFDTVAGITPPADNEALNALASNFSVISSGDTQVVRIDLSQDRLATLGSEGMAWVLSLGDIMLTPTEPVTLTRRRDLEGLFEMTADLARPARVHEFRDPSVGDVLEVVTAYPPARGLTRTLDYVDFSALRSVHGLVVKPANLDVKVAVENDIAVISTQDGLTVSALDHPRELGNGAAESTRSSFIDLTRLEERDPAAFVKTREDLTATASQTDGRERDIARLNLADYYLANQFAHEAIGVLHVLENELKDKNLTRKVRMSLAIADTMAVRPKDALAILNSDSLAEEVDALLWRTIARTDNYEFKGARSDALEAQGIVGSYPLWARKRFYFAAVRSAVESDDTPMAERMLNEIDFGSLDLEEVSLYHLLSGRIDEAAGRAAEAIDTYGQVITADFRPTRAEAIYRTLGLLDKQGNLDLKKATDTLAAEALLWRGNPLESDMQRMLAGFYFREGDYREGFETVKQAVANYPESTPVNELRDDAQKIFSDLYLDGLADSLGPVDALGLYYDFRQLTPAGARGDEMIRNLARRLVKVDLLAQAAQLLNYQLENRLHGVARTQIAADLAVIYLADRKPQDALRVLNGSRLPSIPPSLARQRRVLEARALIDGGRDQLALDVLKDMDGQDADLLRIDAHWKAGRYSQASEMIEAMVLGQDPAQPLGPSTRMNVIKAAVGYVLSGDDFGSARLRSKFSDRMVTTPEWPMFDYVTGQITTNSLEFKKVARDVSGLDGLNAFLDSYRQTYGSTGALAPPFATNGQPALASAQ
ncbi:MAG: hypothetical protein JWP26_3597 [Devosia sp.]|uniref:tetratricopeptide repeat protein n=1 Tax=Devosia sp. TaxID=1871048 RepID=UPI0026056C5D|nr:hypothetical protein [Devosia sp.]MDB5588627.1 hypothetical protein [Devosia sp.]